MPRRSAPFALLALASLALSACTDGGGGYCSVMEDGPAELELPGAGAETWVRTVDLGGSEAAYESLLGVGLGDIPDGCLPLVRTTVSSSGAVEQIHGGLALDASGEGRLVDHLAHRFEPEPDEPILNRFGALRETLGDEHEASLRREAGVLVLTVDGVEARYARLIDRVATLDAGTQAGADEIAALIGHALLTVQTRILGWGTVAFGGEVGVQPHDGACLAGGAPPDGTYSFGGFFQPIHFDVDLGFTGCLELEGLAMTGTQTTTLEIPAGDGSQSGTVSFSLGARTGSLTFDDLVMTNHFLSGGTAALTVDGSAFTVSADAFGPDGLARLFASP